MLAILRFPLIALSFVVEHLRRLPGAHVVDRHATLVATVLVLAGLVIFVGWGLQPAPQRMGIANLAAGELSPMQSWIIVSGELRTETSHTEDFRYRLTDPAVADASMIVVSSIELPVGQTTISGMYTGTREAVPAGFKWVGHMRADPVLAEEPQPPWIALVLATAGLLVGVAGRLSYPMFFAETPRGSVPRTMTLRVGVQRRSDTSAGQFVPGTLRLQPGEPVELRARGIDEQPLRVHSSFTSVDPGELRRLFGSEPALRVRQTIGDLNLSFASRDDRDAAVAALGADARSDRAR